ncbi:hypothetical protein BR93DRAFT_972796 [Coniochaeta sp. PMI_546]|nr:hypothetical protein BR93DRAFT_972796 [Coniochaeta sp. PMI_546]
MATFRFQGPSILERAPFRDQLMYCSGIKDDLSRHVDALKSQPPHEHEKAQDLIRACERLKRTALEGLARVEDELDILYSELFVVEGLTLQDLLPFAVPFYDTLKEADVLICELQRSIDDLSARLEADIEAEIEAGPINTLAEEWDSWTAGRSHRKRGQRFLPTQRR